MTEAEHRAFLASAEYKDWAALRRRVVAGEALPPEEHEQYASVVDRMDAEEAHSFAQAAARTRASVEALEEDNQRLRDRY